MTVFASIYVDDILLYAHEDKETDLVVDQLNPDGIWICH
jgi:hypothetical protein